MLKTDGTSYHTIQATPSSILAARDFYRRQENALKGTASDTDFALYYSQIMGLAVGAATIARFISPWGALGLGLILYAIEESYETDLEKLTSASKTARTMLAELAVILEGKVSPNGTVKFDIQFKYQNFKDDQGNKYGIPIEYKITAYYNSNGDKTMS